MAEYFQSVNNKIVQSFKRYAGSEIWQEVGSGLVTVWLIGMLLELWRPGLVSLYLDLNMILVLGVIGLLAGAIKSRKIGWDSYVIIGLAVVLGILIFLKW